MFNKLTDAKVSNANKCWKIIQPTGTLQMAVTCYKMFYFCIVKIPKDAVNSVTFNWNDTNIASGTSEGDIYIHSVSTTQTSAPLRLPKTQVPVLC